MKHIVLAIIIMLVMTATINAKPLSVNCDDLTDAECSCAIGYVTLAYDVEMTTHLRDTGMSSLMWIWHKTWWNCLYIAT